MATSLADVIKDPNYINANEATKQAIFDKYAPLDPNYTQANDATKEAIRVKFGVAKSVTPVGTIPVGRKEYVPLAQRQAKYQSDVRQTLADLFGGAVSGLADIGATILSPFDIAAKKAQELTGVKQIGFGDIDRRAAVREAARQFLGAEPESVPFKTSTALTQMAAVPPVGKALGTAAAAVPATRALVPALETGGLTAGPTLTGAKALGARALGGAATGAATAGIINPEDIGLGAGIGVGTALLAPVVITSIGKAAGITLDALSGNLPKVQAGKIARNVAADDIDAIRAALRAAPGDINAAQAAYGIHNQGWQALGEMSSRTDPASLLLKQQADNRLAELQRLAQAANPTEARAIQEESRRILNALTAPMGQVELAAANQAAQTMARLEPQAAQRQAGMVSALQQAGKLQTEAAQRAESAARQLQRVEPGRIPAVSATQAARTQAAASRQFGEAGEIFSNIATQRRAERDFIERQIGSLEDYGLRPLDVNPIIAAIDAKIASPGTRASAIQVKALRAIRDDMAELTAKGGGVMDAHDLYTLRKEGLNERIAQLLGPTDPKVSSQVTAKIIGDIRPMIDKAIEQAGGTNWVNYLKTYERGMHGVEQKLMMAEALKMFERNPQAYVDLVRGKNPDAVEAIFGPGKYNIFKEMADKMPTLNKVASEVERDTALKELASKGVEDLNAAIEKGMFTARIPSLLNRKITLANLSLDIVENKLNPKVKEILKEGMLSGKSMLEILDTVPAAERNKVLKVLTNPASWKARPTEAAAIMAAQPTNALAPQQEPVNALAP